MLLFKHGRNRAAAFGMLRERLLLVCWLLSAMALIHQVAGDDPPQPPPVAASAGNTVGFGRHTKSGEKVKLSSDDWSAAASTDDLKAYKDAGALNPCDDIEYEKETGDIIVKYRKDGRTKSKGCMVDLLTKHTTSVDFIIGIKNGNGLEHCLDPTTTYKTNCRLPWPIRTCDKATEYLFDSYANTLPFIYSRTVAEFQSMRNFEPATGDGCPGSCWGNVVCRKWTGLAAGFAKNGGKVARTVVGIGNPGGSGCTLAAESAGNDANYKMTVDNGNMHWFATEGCAGSDEGGFPRDAQCVNKNSMAQELGEKITWEIESPQPDSDFKQLFTFALLPNTATKAHSRQHNQLYGEVGGPKCDELYVKFPGSSFKLLVPKSGAPTIVETLAPPPELVSETPPPVLAPTEDGGGGMVVVIIIVIVLIVAVVGGVLVFFFVIKKSEPDAVEEDYFGTSKAGGTTKTKAGTTVGATQAKTGGLTTVGTKAGTTAGGTAKTAAAATKAGTTVGGKTAGGKTAGGGTTKK
ncbi:unnamed protein product [Meloidogyne enterolobii]|uniref:Uncharacterized protein n=1 Tax=Meloidogyne enterolobii TaxID=390850 RepID=A0ACB0YNA5_MELEN